MFTGLALVDLVVKNWKAALVAAAIALTLWTGAFLYEKGVHKGEAAVTQKITKANAEEMRRAQAAAKTVDDCAAAGGDWDRDVGLCSAAR